LVLIGVAGVVYIATLPCSHEHCGGAGNTQIGSVLNTGGAILVQPTGGGAFGAASSCNYNAVGPVADYCYEVTITSASTGVTLGSLNAQVLLAGGGVDPTAPATGVGIAITSISSGVVAWNAGMSFTTWGHFVSSSTTQVLTSMTIWVDMGTTNPTGARNSLVIYGIGPYSGSESVALP
jgi:hypothetical protein